MTNKTPAYLNDSNAGWNMLKHVFYPRRCFLCRNTIDPEEPEALKRYARVGLCPFCSTEAYRIEALAGDRAEIQACFLYEGELRKAVFDLKYNGRKQYARYFAALMLENETIKNHIRSFDVLCPVPVSKARLLKRGYNQAALIAMELARMTGVRFEELLIRKKDTRALKGLDKNERVRMLSDAFARSARFFELAGSGSAPERILIVDDIATTGTTLEKCEEALREGFSASETMNPFRNGRRPLIRSIAFCTEYEDNA